MRHIGTGRGWLVLLTLALCSVGDAITCKIEIALAAERPVEGRMHNFTRDAAVYLLNALSATPVEVPRGTDRLTLDATQFPQEIRATLTALELTGPDAWAPAFTTLKRLAGEGWYNEARERRLGYFLPESQEQFLEDIGMKDPFRPWRENGFLSAIKPETRTVLRSLPNRATRAFPEGLPKISLATSAARPFEEETEVIIQRADGKHWDFYSYRNGRLARFSEVRTRGDHLQEAPAPYSCLACHYNPFNRTFARAPVSFVHGYSERILQE